MSDAEAITPSEQEDARGGFGSLGSIIYLLMLTWAAGIAAFPLNDNSFFTHLATGRIILAEGSVPSIDPYTFTAQGEPWTVQSWLASVAYASAEQIGGDVGLRVLVLAVFALAITLLWTLTAPVSSIAVRFLLVAAALFVVTDLWSERPYMVGVIGLGILWLALEGSVRAWLLVPLMWVWVNTHGSWVLAFALLATLVLGAALDRRASGGNWGPTAVERRVAGFLVIGTVLGAASPLGPKVLSFPLAAYAKSEVFSEIIEWRAPTFMTVAERAFLVLVFVAVMLLVRRGSRRLALPAVVFAAAGLYAQRNIVMATVVLVATCARAAPAVGSLTARNRPRVGTALAAAMVLLTVGTAVLAVATPVVSADALGGYPARPVALLELESLPNERVAAEPSTGNLIEVLGAPAGSVFVDDRVDMFPSEVFDDSLTLGRGQAEWDVVLDRYEIDAIIWAADASVTELLRIDDGWRISYADTQWVIACRRGGRCPTSLR